nr:HD domain-containing phosphohydrolase [Deinococcus sp. Arct2-2]
MNKPADHSINLPAQPHEVAGQLPTQLLYEEALALLETEPQTALARAQAACKLAFEADNIALQARVLLLLGRAQLQTADTSGALETFVKAAGAYKSANDDLGQAESEGLAGRASLNLGQLEEAETYLRTAITKSENQISSRAKSIQATALNQLAGVQHYTGASLKALDSLQQASNLWEDENNYVGQANCLINIGNIQTNLGQYSQAITSLSSAYQIYKNYLKDFKTETSILQNLARAHHLNGDNDLAVTVMYAAKIAAEASEDGILQATAYLNLGTFLLESNEYLDAKKYLELALRLSSSLDFAMVKLSTLDSLGSLYEQTGHLHQASDSHQQALAIAIAIGATQGELEARLHLGRLHLNAGELEPALLELQLALELAEKNRSPKEQATAHESLATLFEQQGDLGRSVAHLRALRQIERELFHAERDRQTRNLTIQFEVERARHDADVYRLRTEVEHEARRTAEQLVQERTSDLARAQHEVVTRLAMAAEYRDDTTGEHTRRVGRTSCRIARALGWEEAQISVLGVAARLHDVGKIGIPDSILLKSGKLDAAEYNQMQTHTLIGARILSGGRSKLLQLAEEIALTHHERWDGTGYPRGLSQDQIPLSGRIVAVADVYDALTQARPYKPAWTPQDAMAEIRRQAGAHFDPVVVEAALTVLSAAEQLEAGQHANLPGEAAFLEDLPMAEEDASQVLSVFEQLLIERTTELQAAREEAERTAQQLQHLTLTDQQTGLGNRHALEHAVAEAIQAAQSGIQPLSLATLTFDLHLAKNTVLGQEGTDVVMPLMATALAQHVAEGSRIYRTGSTTFVLLGVQPPDAATIEAICTSALAPVRAAAGTTVAIHIGTARFPEDATDPALHLRPSEGQPGINADGDQSPL